MTTRGHNERSYRLDTLASDAREGLANVEKGEEFTIGGWLAYGHALNEGRALFPADRDFGQWVTVSQLDTPDRMDRAAAMWAAANADQFEEARQRGNPRTIRGIHAKWKEIEAEREAEQRRQEAEARKAAEATPADAGSKPDQEQYETPVHKPAGEPAADKAGISVAPVAADGPAPSNPAPKPADDVAKLTREGLEDEVRGLRVENAELREKLAKVEAERDRFKAANKDLTGSDQGATISRLQKQLNAAKYARDEAMSATKREEYKRKKAEAELKRLTSQEIEI